MSAKVSSFSQCCFYFQVRSPTDVHGKAASGALHGAMSSPDTSGSTLERSHSNAVTATGETGGKRVCIHDGWYISKYNARSQKQRLSTKTTVWVHASFRQLTFQTPQWSFITVLCILSLTPSSTYVWKLDCRSDMPGEQTNAGQGWTDGTEVEVNGVGWSSSEWAVKVGMVVEQKSVGAAMRTAARRGSKELESARRSVILTSSVVVTEPD